MAKNYPMQWYNRDPERYRYEVNAVYQTLHKLDPQEVQLPDGRRGFTMTFRIPDPEGNITNPDGSHYQSYRVLMAWNTDHPHCADKHFGGSVRTYFQSPTVGEIERAYLAHGRTKVPHLMFDQHPVTGATIRIPCTQSKNKEDNRFTMVSAAALLTNWLAAMTAGKYRESAYRAFCVE